MARRALSATRAADLLNFLAAHPEERLTYSQLSKRLDINLSSMHTLLVALTECGYLAYRETDRAYTLGSALVAIGDAALQKNRLVDEARSCMKTFSEESHLEALAFVRAGPDALCVARAGPEQPQGDSARVGQRVPLVAPLASAIVAWASEEEQAAWIERGGAPQNERRRQRKLLTAVRARGYSIALDVAGRRKIGELLVELAEDPHSTRLRREMRSHISELGHGEYQLTPGSRRSYPISTLTAPVFDESGDFALALSLQGFPRQMSQRAIDRAGEGLLRLCRTVGERGGRNRESP
jgi:DNA-binding IclR family transcriptional regulator